MILVRADVFTRWFVLLEGIGEAAAAGASIKKAGLEFDVAYTSVLSRAIKTLDVALEASNQV